jgi:Family of unknown function (DUF6325)
VASSASRKRSPPELSAHQGGHDTSASCGWQDRTDTTLCHAFEQGEGFSGDERANRGKALKAGAGKGYAGQSVTHVSQGALTGYSLPVSTTKAGVLGEDAAGDAREAIMSLGPVEYIVIGFPGNKFKGDILPALGDLVSSGLIRIMDLAFVKKDADGSILAFEFEELATEEAEAFAFEKAIGDLLNEDDLMLIGDELEPDTSAAVLIWENLWARRFAETVREAGGVLIDSNRIPYDVVQAAIDYAQA